MESYLISARRARWCSRVVSAAPLSGIGAALLFVLGCAVQHDIAVDATGVASLALSESPPDARCLRVTVTGSQWVERTFDLEPGEPATFTLDHLPLGTVTFAALAYAEPCIAVDAASVPTWLSDIVEASLEAGRVARVMLVMRRGGGEAEVSIDFESLDGGAAPDAAMDAGDDGIAVEIHFPASGFTSADQLTVRGAVVNADAHQIGKVRVGSLTTAVGEDGAFSLLVPLPLSVNTIEVEVIDEDGQLSASASVVVVRGVDWRDVSDFVIAPDGSIFTADEVGRVLRVDPETEIAVALRDPPPIVLRGNDSRAPDYPSTWGSTELFNFRGIDADWSTGTLYGLAAADQIVDSSLRSSGHYAMVPHLIALDVATGSLTTTAIAGPTSGANQERNSNGDLLFDAAHDRILTAVTALDTIEGANLSLAHLICGTYCKVESIALAEDGRLLVLLESVLLAVDSSTAEYEVITHVIPGQASSIATDAMGHRILMSVLDAVYAIDPTTGAQSILSGPSAGTGPWLGYIRELRIDPSGANAVVISDLGLTAIDLASGDRTRIIAQPTFGPQPHSCSSQGGSTPEYVYELDPALDEIYVYGSYGDGEFIAADFESDPVTAQGAIVRVSTATGARTVISDSKSSIGSGPALWNPGALVLDEAGQHAFVIDAAARSVFVVDLATGDRSVLSAGDMRNAGFRPVGLIRNGTTLVVLDKIGNVFTVDIMTGARMLVSGLVPQIGPSRGTGPLFASFDDWALCDDVLRANNAAVDLISGDRIAIAP